MARDGGEAKVTVWFDGGCPLCRREIGLFRRLDRRGAIHFIDVATAEAGGGSCPIDRSDLLAWFHAREEGVRCDGGDGRLLSGAAAFAAMWRAIPVLSPFGRMARNAQVLKVFEALYRAFLRIRPRIQQAVVRLESLGRGSSAA